MDKLPESYDKAGFYLIMEFKHKGKKYIQCGKLDSFDYYFFQINDGQIQDITDKELLKELSEKYIPKPDSRVY